MIGAPGSGKSTWAEKMSKEENYVYLSSDKNRSRLGTGEDDQKVSGRAFALLKEEMKQALDEGKDVILDACFMSKKSRRDFVITAKTKGAILKAVSFEISRETILERNKKRAENGGRNVPTFVIDRMLGNYQKPDSVEFDEVVIIDENYRI